MILKSLILTTSLIGSVAIVSNTSSNLTQNSIKKEPNFDIFRTSEPKKLTEQEKKWINLAINYNQKIHQQNMQLNSQKQYVTGLDKFEIIKAVMHVWVTKAYLGNVATVLGVVGAGIALAVGVIALALAAAGASAIVTGGLGLILMPVIGILYAAATATIMNKINSYEIGGYFKADFSLIGTPITVLSTIRSQNQYESASRLKKLDSKIKFANADSYDFLDFDMTNGKTRSFWTINQEEQDYFIGVLDISRYTRYSHGMHIKGIQGFLGLRSDIDEVINLHDQSIENFLTKYYNKNSNDYLFVVLKKMSENQYQLQIGGSKFSGNKEQSHDWLLRDINLQGKPHDLAIDFHIEIGKN